jgi:hypothetical protein
MIDEEWSVEDFLYRILDEGLHYAIVHYGVEPHNAPAFCRDEWTEVYNLIQEGEQKWAAMQKKYGWSWDTIS